MARGALVSVRGALVRFAVASGVTLAVVCLTATVLSARIAHEESLDEAEHAASRMAETLAGSTLYADADNPGHEAGLEQLDRLVRQHIRAGHVLRVKVWDRDGTVIYSDERRQVGRRFELGSAEVALFGTGGATVEVTELDAVENELDRRLGQAGEDVVEVYAAFESIDGRRLLFEGYLPAEDLLHHRQELLVALLPAMVLGPLVMLVVMLPVVLGLVRNLRDADQQRMRWVGDLFRARREERRRVALELHDGVLPELAGVRLSLDLAVQEVERTGSWSPPALRHAAQAVGDQIRALRAMLSDLRTPAVERMGLANAMRDLAGPLADSGVDVVVEVNALDLSATEVQMAYAVVREGLRNVQRHTSARRVRVGVETRAGDAVIQVGDDGREPGKELPRQLGSEHGLGLIADAVAELGGALSLRASGARGTVLEVRLPRQRGCAGPSGGGSDTGRDAFTPSGEHIAAGGPARLGTAPDMQPAP